MNTNLLKSVSVKALDRGSFIELGFFFMFVFSVCGLAVC